MGSNGWCPRKQIMKSALIESRSETAFSIALKFCAAQSNLNHFSKLPANPNCRNIAACECDLFTKYARSPIPMLRRKTWSPMRIQNEEPFTMAALANIFGKMARLARKLSHVYPVRISSGKRNPRSHRPPQMCPPIRKYRNCEPCQIGLAPPFR